MGAGNLLLSVVILLCGLTFTGVANLVDVFNHRYTTLNRDWKRITRTKIGVFRISIHIAHLFCLLQQLDAQQANEKYTIDSREAVADPTSSS